MSKMISAEACLKYAEICRYRSRRLMDIQETVLFESLTKICEQAAKAISYELLRELQQESEKMGLYDPPKGRHD